jgi:hypothetical protein
LHCTHNTHRTALKMDGIITTRFEVVGGVAMGSYKFMDQKLAFLMTTRRKT